MKTRLGIALTLVAVVASLATIRSYRVLVRDTGAQLLWSADRAYLFLGTNELGWHLSYARLAFEPVVNWLQTVTIAQDSRPTVTIFTITSSGVQRYVASNMMLGMYAVVDDHIVSGPWRWAGDRFEPTTEGEKRRWLENFPSEFSNVAGWSKRSLNAGSYPVDLGGQRVVLTVSDETGARTIDLQRTGKPPERIWSLDHHVRSVSKADYDRLFGAATVSKP